MDKVHRASPIHQALINTMKLFNRRIPPFWILPSVIIMTILHYLWPVYIYLPDGWSYLGFIPFAASLWLTGTGAKLLARIGTTISPSGEPEKLATVGIYRYSRNPMYLGMSLIVLGAAMLFGSVSALLGVAFFMVTIQRLFIVKEEALLLEKFGQEYQAYCAQVRRWI